MTTFILIPSSALLFLVPLFLPDRSCLAASRLPNAKEELSNDHIQQEHHLEFHRAIKLPNHLYSQPILW